MIILLSLCECIHSLNLYRRGKQWSFTTSAVGLCIQRIRAPATYDHGDELECEGPDSEHDHHVHVVPIVTAITHFGAALSWTTVGAICVAVTVLATELAHICVSPHLLFNWSSTPEL
jgi:hypothetical protein